MRLRIALAAIVLSIQHLAQGYAAQLSPPPREVFVPSGTTVIAVMGDASADEPAGEALLMWGVQPREQPPGPMPLSNFLFEGGKNTTTNDVAVAVAAIRAAIAEDDANVRGQLVRKSSSPEFLGKIVVTLKHPSAERIERVLDAVAKVGVKGLDVRAVGTWYFPASSCDELSARSSAAALAKARVDVALLGAALALHPITLLLSYDRGAPPAQGDDPYLCAPSIPHLPLASYAAPRPVRAARFVIERTRVVVYSVVRAGRLAERKIERSDSIETGTGAIDAVSEPFVHLRVLSHSTQVVSTATAEAYPALGAVLLRVNVYGDASRAFIERLRGYGFDPQTLREQNGSNWIGILAHGSLVSDVAAAKRTLQNSLVAEGLAAQVDAIQSVPFARTCERYRGEALAAAARQARANDETLASDAGHRLADPIAIVEKDTVQNVICGAVPQTTLEAMTLPEPSRAYDFDSPKLGYIRAAVEVAYATR